MKKKKVYGGEKGREERNRADFSFSVVPGKLKALNEDLC